MINFVAGDATAGPRLPPQAQWINLPVGYNVSFNPSHVSNLMLIYFQVSDNPSINVSPRHQFKYDSALLR